MIPSPAELQIASLLQMGVEGIVAVTLTPKKNEETQTLTVVSLDNHNENYKKIQRILIIAGVKNVIETKMDVQFDYKHYWMTVADITPSQIEHLQRAANP